MVTNDRLTHIFWDYRMNIMSWNVNGIRAAIKKGFLDFLEEYSPDILCLQEVKAERNQVDSDFSGYYVFWNHATCKKGYSGTALLTKTKPINVVNGFLSGQADDEGRVQTAEYENFFLVNVYTPNSKRDLSRLHFRYNDWDPLFLAYVASLDKTKPVIFCGDLNVSHQEIDLANPKTNKKNAGFTPEEREGFDNIVGSGFVDSFRYLYPDTVDAYTWWSYRAGARERNIGWRLDYFCVSSSLAKAIEEAAIYPEVGGSDHCPVGVVVRI